MCIPLRRTPFFSAMFILKLRDWFTIIKGDIRDLKKKNYTRHCKLAFVHHLYTKDYKTLIPSCRNISAKLKLTKEY